MICCSFPIVNSVIVDANMEGASVGGVGLGFVLDGVGRGLDVHVFFRDIYVCGKEVVPPQVSLASREERTFRNCESAGPSSK